MKQYDVWWVTLDPAVGKDIKKTRPCIIISPDEMNHFIGTVIIAPCTSAMRLYPSRVKFELRGKSAAIALDQIKTIDKSRLKNKVAHLELKTIKQIRQTMEEIFCK